MVCLLCYVADSGRESKAEAKDAKLLTLLAGEKWFWASPSSASIKPLISNNDTMYLDLSLANSLLGFQNSIQTQLEPISKSKASSRP